MRGVMGLAGLAVAASAGALASAPSTSSRSKASPTARVPRTSLRWMEQLGPGGYLNRDLIKAGLGRGGCQKLPSTATKAERLEAHRQKMADKKALRAERAGRA